MISSRNRALGRAARILFLSTALASVGAFAQDAARAKEVFNERVQPIIFKSCNGCHTFGGHAGGLTMDSYESFLKGGDKGPVFKAGDPEHSLMIQAVKRVDPGFVMPPMRPLLPEDVEILEAWVKDPTGATMPAASASVVIASPSQMEVGTKKAYKAAGPMLAEPIAKPGKQDVKIAEMKATPEQEQFFENKVRPLLTKNCYTCHTVAMYGGLRLDSRETILKGGLRGPAAIAGDPANSLMVKAVKKEGLSMPPTAQLKPEDIATLEQWIQDGLAWPKSKSTQTGGKVTEEQRKNHWAFTAPVKPAVPAGDAKWAYNDIDKFVTAKQAEMKVKPVADADRRTLIRRITYDITGLPPTPEEVQAFVDDKSPKAYANLVEKILGSKAYGERWGRKWLDVVRYGDTSGGDGDFPVPQASKYRDYVIKAFNEDKPYNRFLREQLAGDLLPSNSEEERWNNIVATGYLAITNREDGRPAYVADAVDNLGAAFMGLTVGCARCHDHKFDPIPTADYYSIYGILSSANYAEPGNGNARYQRGFTYRDPKATQREDYKTFQAQFKPIADAITAVRRLPGTYDDLVPQLEARRMHLFEHMPDVGESAYAVTEGEAADAAIQHYGDPKDLGPVVKRGFLQVLGGGPLPDGTKGSGRLELADWLTNGEHPLTARVMVNRIWQEHFGRGLVATANDFGSRGTPPSDQALLDYLAVKFVESGWSIKALQREILLSHAYQLASTDNPANSAIDPDNAYVWRHSRQRMDAEQIRDTLLAQSGLLDTTPAGEHPFPPAYIWNWEDQNQFAPNPADYETDRRTVYTMVPRSTRLLYFNLFDGPNVNVSTEKRSSSLTPLQALYFMNAPFPKRAASSLAGKLLAAKTPEKDTVQRAFLTVFGRPATQPEVERSLTYLHGSADLHQTQASKDASPGTPQSKAWTDFLQAMFASNEFMFIE